MDSKLFNVHSQAFSLMLNDLNKREIIAQVKDEAGALADFDLLLEPEYDPTDAFPIPY